MILRNTLAYRIKYGIGVFCLLETREQQVGWVPENYKSPLERRVHYTAFKERMIGQVAKFGKHFF